MLRSDFCLCRLELTDWMQRISVHRTGAGSLLWQGRQGSSYELEYQILVSRRGSCARLHRQPCRRFVALYHLLLCDIRIVGNWHGYHSPLRPHQHTDDSHFLDRITRRIRADLLRVVFIWRRSRSALDAASGRIHPSMDGHLPWLSTHPALAVAAAKAGTSCFGLMARRSAPLPIVG